MKIKFGSFELEIDEEALILLIPIVGVVSLVLP